MPTETIAVGAPTPSVMLTPTEIGTSSAITLTLPAATTRLVATSSASGSSLLIAPLGGPDDDQTAVFNAVGTVTVTADVAGYLVVVPLNGAMTSQIAVQTSAAPVRALIDVQGCVVRGTTSGSGRLYPKVRPDLRAWARVDAATAITLSLPDPPAGALAVSLRVTATAADGPTTLASCPGGTVSQACADNGVVTVDPRSGAVSNNTLVPPDTSHPTQVTLRAIGSTATRALRGPRLRRS